MTKAFLLPDLFQIKAEKARRRFHTFLREFAWPEVQSGQTFVDNWHIHAICEHLEAVHSGQIRRLIINMPFRMLKSTIISQAFPAWEWIDRPHLQFFTASYAKDLATRDAVNSRKIIESPRYQQAWGDKFHMTSDQNVKTRYENNHNGSRAVVSTDSGGTGLGGNRVLWDDPLSAREADSPVARTAAVEFWRGTLVTRLNNPAVDAHVITHQRLHKNDPTGYILANEGAEEWDHLILPMRFTRKVISLSSIGYVDPRKTVGELMFPARLNDAAVTSLEVRLGSYHASAKLQQIPESRDGGLFKKEWFPIIDEAPIDCEWVRGWDLAATEEGERANAPWTVGLKLGRTTDGEFVIAHVARERFDSGDVEELIVNTAKADGPSVAIDIPQDPGQAGKSQVRYFVKQLAGYTVHYSPETGSKWTRASPVASQAKAGNVSLVAGPWNTVFLDEVESCDGFMDQIDALSRAFHRLMKSVPIEPNDFSPPVVIASEDDRGTVPNAAFLGGFTNVQ